jgi:hypothetical protein
MGTMGLVTIDSVLFQTLRLIRWWHFLGENMENKKTEVTQENVDIARLAMGAYQSYTDKPARVEVFAYNDGSSAHDISGQINPCLFGDQCEGHACYCNNEKAGCRKCHFSWYNGEKDLDKTCEFYEPNPYWIEGKGDFYEQRDATIADLHAKGLVEIEITKIDNTPPEHYKGKKSKFYDEKNA